MFFVYVVLFIVFILVLDHFIVDKRQLELSKQFNGPIRLPLIGTFYEFFGITQENIIEELQKMLNKYGRTKTKVTYSWIFNKLELIIDDYKLIEKITTNQKFISKGDQYDFLHPAVGEGLLFSTGQKWFNRRRIITPTFHFKILEQFFHVFKVQNQMLIKKLGKVPDGKTFDIFPTIANSVLNSLCETAMGQEMKDDSEYANTVKELQLLVGNRLLSAWQRIDFLYNLSSPKKELDKCIKVIQNFTTRLIEERRKILLNQPNDDLQNLDDEDLGLKKKMCLLDVLLQANIDGKPLSNDDILEEVNTFTLAGTDTTTNAICFTLYAISQHPNVQEKLNKEIEEVLGDEELTFKKLNEFKYLDLVVKESLRLYPPVPSMSRRLFEEVDLGDFIAPANTNYNIFVYSALRNPNVFENPDKFIPERFLKELPHFSFVPFSAGQRNCIGQRFAMTNIKTNIIGILKNFTLVNAGIEPKLMISLTLRCDALHVGFKKK